MSMDALTLATCQSLLSEALPVLMQELEAVMATGASDLESKHRLSELVTEVKNLLDLVDRWTKMNGDEPEGHENSILPAAGDENLSPDDEMMLAALQEAESETPATLMQDPLPEQPDAEMSDEEAMALLTGMDTDAPPEAPKSTDLATSNEEMSDDEARKLLEYMDDLTAAPAPAAVAAATPAHKASAATATSDSHQSEHASGGDIDLVGEISEWEANDFQTDPDMVNDFVTNSDTLMETLDEAVLQLELEPENPKIIEEIFRAAHTLKGGAGMFGFRGIERVMHRMENLFDLVRKGKLVPSTIDVVFKGLDCLRVLLKAVKDGKPCGSPTAEIVNALSAAASGKQYKIKDSSKPVDVAAVKTEASKPQAIAEPVAGHAPQTPAADSSKKESKKELPTIRVDLERLDALVNLVGELVIDRTRFVSIEEELRSNHPQIKLDGNISETVQLFSRHMNEIQDIIMKVRMVPIGSQFNRYTRIVRDIAKQLGKKIDLHIAGEDAELDKTIVEQIGDPLVHLIRNSCDHGVELPDDRVAKGKSPTGRIALSALQEGNHILITIEDDGKGIPVDIIRRKGIEKGLIKETDVLSDKEIFNLIFEPGFSTAEKVTEISGRGVGMDVVKKQIMKLKGSLDIDSTFGQGTRIQIRLPLTLAIVQSLLVNVCNETFAIPLASVSESIRISPDQIQRVGDAEVIRLRDRVLPLLHLDHVLGLESKQGTLSDLMQQRESNHKKPQKARKKDRLFVVVVGSTEQPFGIIVDHLLNQQEMVIKSMGPLLHQIPCVAGGALLGQGEVIMVLDIQELESHFRTKNRGKTLAAA